MSVRLFLLIFLSLSFIISCGNNEQRLEGGSESQAPESSVLSGSDLHSAALNGHSQQVEEAIGRGVTVDYIDELGRTALMFASFNGHTEIVRLLIDEGAEVNLRNDEGRTPLMFAASGPFRETVLLLLAEGAEVNVQDSIEGWTALMYAAAEGNKDVVENLLDQGADATLEDDDGDTAIDFATDNGHTQIVRDLRNSLRL